MNWEIFIQPSWDEFVNGMEPTEWEVDALKENDTWLLVTRFDGDNIIDRMCIYKVNYSLILIYLIDININLLSIFGKKKKNLLSIFGKKKTYCQALHYTYGLESGLWGNNLSCCKTK